MKAIIRFLTIASLCAISMACADNSLVPDNMRGVWSGEIDGLGLAIVVHLGDTCTFDSPDQGAYGLAAEYKNLRGGALKLKFKGIPGNIKGRLEGDSLICTFSQVGIKKRLAMGRGPLVRNRPQTPCPPFPYDIEEVSFGHDSLALSGTLTSHAGCDPSKTTAVVFVSGSGKQDRDETLMDHRPFAVLSDALARNSIASLRYDDRGCGKSGGVFEECTTFDFADDARAALNFLRNRGFSSVGVIGHSEGGTIAFIMAADESNAPDFIVSLAGMADRGDSTLVRQMTRMFELQGVPGKMAAFAAKTSMRKMVKQKNIWLDCFLSLDPAPYISAIKCPCLALNGEKDCQVIPEFNLSKIQALCKDAETKLYPDLNHLFQHCTTGLSDEYSRIEETFSPEVASDIIAWIQKR